MQPDVTHFSCTGCGVCCKGRLIPLTLDETRQWLRRGHDVSVIVEAFDESNWAGSSQQFSHASGRSVTVRSGDASVQLIALFAGRALEQCPNLKDDNLCGIYEERPLVCRIYPMEINPFIPLVKEKKACPPEAWQSDEVICTDGRADPTMQALIHQSRQADKDDAAAKVAICAALGLNVSGWKDDALVVYFPERVRLLEAIDRAGDGSTLTSETQWRVRVDKPSLRNRLAQAAIELADNEPGHYIFHEL